MKKQKEKFTWSEIRKCLYDCYKHDGSPDSWGVKVLYYGFLQKRLKIRLYKKASRVNKK